MKNISVLEKSMFLGAGATWCGIEQTEQAEPTIICMFPGVNVYRVFNDNGVRYILELIHHSGPQFEINFNPGELELVARTAKAIATGSIRIKRLT